IRQMESRTLCGRRATLPVRERGFDFRVLRAFAPLAADEVAWMGGRSVVVVIAGIFFGPTSSYWLLQGPTSSYRVRGVEEKFLVLAFSLGGGYTLLACPRAMRTMAPGFHRERRWLDEGS